MPARRRSRATKQRELRHVRLYHWLMDTPAWHSLDAVARAVYVHIASRYAGPGSNNGRIPYSVREAAAELHIGKSTASRALQRLEERGFLVATQRGGFNCKIRHSSEWRLTEFGCDVTGELATKDFAKWGREKQNAVPPGNRTVPVTRPNGTGNGTRSPSNGGVSTSTETDPYGSGGVSVPEMGHL